MYAQSGVDKNEESFFLMFRLQQTVKLDGVYFRAWCNDPDLWPVV